MNIDLIKNVINNVVTCAITLNLLYFLFRDEILKQKHANISMILWIVTSICLKLLIGNESRWAYAMGMALLWGLIWAEEQREKIMKEK